MLYDNAVRFDALAHRIDENRHTALLDGKAQGLGMKSIHLLGCRIDQSDSTTETMALA